MTNQIELIAPQQQVRKNRKFNRLNLLLLSNLVALQVYAGTDDMFSETVDYWLNVLQGSGGKFAMLIAAVPIVVSLIAQRYTAFFIILAIYAFLMFLLPALMGGLSATIPLALN